MLKNFKKHPVIYGFWGIMCPLAQLSPTSELPFKQKIFMVIFCLVFTKLLVVWADAKEKKEKKIFLEKNTAIKPLSLPVCASCGAPLADTVCEYCGTRYQIVKTINK